MIHLVVKMMKVLQVDPDFDIDKRLGKDKRIRMIVIYSYGKWDDMEDRIFLQMILILGWTRVV